MNSVDPKVRVLYYLFLIGLDSDFYMMKHDEEAYREYDIMGDEYIRSDALLNPKITFKQWIVDKKL